MKEYAIDNSAILYLALIRKHHTNTFRFTITLSAEIQPDLLQTAVNRVFPRFPTIFAGFRQDRQVTAVTPPQVTADPGMLIPMTKAEIARCACRVYHCEKDIILEGFHALTDGYGMVALLATLAAEYLHLAHGLQIPAGYPVLSLTETPDPEETEDAYLKYAGATPRHLPSRYSYQLPGFDPKCGPVRTQSIVIPAEELLSSARQHGVSITALLSAVMAASVMELQQHCNEKRLRPVRIMVPIDLRKIFPSKTLRNFILYALPTMEVSEYGCGIPELALRFSRQIQAHLSRENLACIIARNVKTQNMPLFRMLPFRVKCGLMRLAYTYFGESNSSLTMTNLGNISLPEAMVPYVTGIGLTLMPRVHSPYNCSMYSCQGNFFIHISRFQEVSQLERIFSRNLRQILAGKETST